MHSINYPPLTHDQLSLRQNASKGNTNTDRTSTNPSLCNHTIPIQDSQNCFGHRHDQSSQQLASSHLFHHQIEGNLSTYSQLKLDHNLDSETVKAFLLELKLVAFKSSQNRETKQFIARKQQYVGTLRVQVNEMEEQLKAQKLRYDKKDAQFKLAKLRIKKKKQLKNREMAAQFQQLHVSIKRMKNKIKLRKLKTQPINTSLQQNHNQTTNKTAEIRKKPIYPYYCPTIPLYYHPQNYYPQPKLSNAPPIYAHPPQNHEYSWQMKLNDSNYRTQNVDKNKLRTEATHESKFNQEPSSGTRGRRILSDKSTPRNSKTAPKKTSQISNKDQQSFKQTESVELKKKNSQKEQSKPKPATPDLKYFSSECESQNQSLTNFIGANASKQSRGRNVSNLRYKQQESQCNTYQKHLYSQAEQWMQLMAESRDSRSKAQKNALSKDLAPEFIKVFEDRSQKCSERGSSRSNVNVTISSDEHKQKQTLKSSSDQSKKLLQIKNPIIQSVVAISLSGAGSSKVSRRSRGNTQPEQATEKEGNRYIPHLAKQCMMIEEESEEAASLKATPNQFATPRSHSQNQKSPTNSQKQKKISVIQEEEEESSPLKKPPALPTAQHIHQRQNDGFLSKIQLNAQSKNLKKMVSIGMKQEDDDILAGICLVGQSKIARSRLKSNGSSAKNDVDEVKELKTRSEIKKETVQADQFDDFDFVLGGESNIVKKGNSTANRRSMGSSPSNASQRQEKSRFNASTISYQLNQNAILEREENEEDSPSNQNAKRKRKH